MMMPAVWWSAGALPGRHVKSGNSDNATFMRNVPEPQRQWLMRSRNSSGTAPAANIFRNSSLGLRLEIMADHAVEAVDGLDRIAFKPALEIVARRRRK